MQVEPKKKSKKLKYSTIHLLINTNVKYDTPESLEEGDFKLQQIMYRLLGYLKVLDYIEIKQEGDTLSDETIKKVTVDGDTELAEKTGYLHYHAMIEISHYTLIKLNIDAIRDDIYREMGLPHKPYIQYKLHKNSAKYLAAYIHKDAPDVILEK
jgi:hypothetical protein